MKISDCKKRIEEAVEKLNEMEHRVVFSFVEDENGICLCCCSKANGSSHFGAYEYAALFDEYTCKNTAYEGCMRFTEVIIAAQRLTSADAYHNLVG